MSNILKKLKHGGKKQKSAKTVFGNSHNGNNITINEKLTLISETYKNNAKFEEYLIDNVTIAVMKKNVMEKLAVYEMVNLNKNKTLEGSSEDPRTGTIENNIKCPTCNKTNEDCSGHPSIINLDIDILHPFFIEIALKVLKSICIHCNNLILSENYMKEKGILKYNGKNRLQLISSHSEKNNCRNPSCGSNFKFKNPVKKTDRNYRTIQYVLKNGDKHKIGYLSVERIKKIFKTISEKDAKILGFGVTHPSDFIIDFIPVIPLSARPYNYSSGEKKDNYLTVLYENILSKKIEIDQISNPSSKENLYNDIANIYMYNLIKTHADFIKMGRGQENGKSIDEILSKGKESLMRSHLMGKRGDYGSRSVLGSNRSLNFGYLSLPDEVKQITLPDVITSYNIDFYKKYGERGGIVYLCPAKGNRTGVKLNYRIDKHELNIGDIIHRKIMENDSVIFNRQPTLHRQSILGYKCDFQDKYAVGVHLFSTGGHNADFDGDEGNQIYVQDTFAQAEAKYVMNAENSIMSFTYSKPQASFVYNCTTSAYKITMDNIEFTKEEFYEGIEEIKKYSKSNYAEENLKTLFERAGETKYTGKLLFSVLLPPDFYYVREKDGKNIVKIINGVLKYGILTKADVGASQNSIIQSLWKWYGGELTGKFFSDSSFLLNWYLFRSGFTVGTRDCQIIDERKEEFDKKKLDIINDAKDKIKNLPEITSSSSMFEREEHEVKINKELEETRTKIYKMLIGENYLYPNNALLAMTNSGGKGSKVNTTNIICLLGQPKVDEQRPQKTMTNGRRWLSSFSIYDNTPESRGYCNNSFFDGLGPNEMFAQAQEGRVGLISTAIKTGQTGYLYRKITKAQEDLTYRYDGTVRNQSDIIFQYTHGSCISTQNSVINTDEYDNPLYSFINISELIGRINTESGMEDISIGEAINSSVKEINMKHRLSGEDDNVFDGEEDKNVELFEVEDEEGELLFDEE